MFLGILLRPPQNVFQCTMTNTQQYIIASVFKLLMRIQDKYIIKLLKNTYYNTERSEYCLT